MIIRETSLDTRYLLKCSH